MVCGASFCVSAGVLSHVVLRSYRTNGHCSSKHPLHRASLPAERPWMRPAPALSG
ncbi:hypothetical protein JOF44_000556 [Brachybacterium fresconis]|uniref:Uncharacterized protein n=1 Tax=Brachybacterium fresconis TaxID=173363 RepID=A0ABS4YID0_9MICO|nr:hypothetical protein [Brachybacterium fresconis]